MLFIVCHILRNTDYLIGWVLFAILAPIILFLQSSIKEFIAELHYSNHVIVRVRSVDGRSRHIISAFERLIEHVVSTNINDANRSAFAKMKLMACMRIVAIEL